MLKGDYKKLEPVPCNKEDLHYFRKMMRDMVLPKNYKVFVKQVHFGDVFVSETAVKRWKIISENGKLFLGFYEKPMHEMHYQGTECPKSYYIVVEDERKNSQQKYALVKIQRWEAWQVFGINK